MKSKPILAFLGLGLLGYGALVVLNVVAHEAPLAGALSLATGGALLLAGLPPLHLRHGRLVAALGTVCVLGIIGYNVAKGSGLGVPEWGILVYGVLLLLAAPRLDRKIRNVEVGTLVAWSFPLLLAPLAMFALNAAITTERGETAGAPLVHALVVLPSAAFLQLIGTPLTVEGNSFIVATSRGTMRLGVGLVCAGLYPMVLFGGLLGLHAWQQGIPQRRLWAYLGLGILGLWAMNLVRLVILTKVGQRWGMQTLETVHAHIGWIMFALFMVLFWGVVIRRFEQPHQV